MGNPKIIAIQDICMGKSELEKCGCNQYIGILKVADDHGFQGNVGLGRCDRWIDGWGCQVVNGAS